MWTILIVMLAQAQESTCQDPNCLVCESWDTGDVCLKCTNGLFPSGFQCVPCDHDIIECEPCDDGLWNCKCNSPSSESHCSTCPGDCSHCDSRGTCHVHPLGFYLDANGDLQNCPEKCSACAGENWCTQCKDGLAPDNGNCCVPGCKECSMSSCTACEDGFEKVGENCAHKSAKCSEGCSKCFNENVCFECGDGYYLEGDSCVPCDENCLICDNFGCNLCTRGFGVKDGVCVPCTTSECPVRCRENCEECKSDLTCVRCVGGSDVSAGPVCYPKYCYQNCASFGELLCRKCNEGYYLSVVLNYEGCCKKLCRYPALESLNDGTALVCREGYKVVAGCCQPICYYDNCLAVDFLGNCVKCPIGFINENGCCKPYCCKKSAVHCVAYFLGYCVQCEAGWFLVNGCCQPKCPTFLSQPSSYSIIVGNYVQECFACRWPAVDTPSGCCAFKCCKKSEDNCLAISIFGHCALCKPGWTINAFGCCVKKQCTVYPNEYFDHGVWCFRCPEGYFERDGCCFPRCCDKSRKVCKTWGTNGFCFSCYPGYYVGPYGCCIPKCANNLIISNWFVPNQGWCYKCPDGYTIIGYYQETPTSRWIYSECCKPKCCPKSSAQCASYFPNGWCKSCKDGYILSSRGCCIPKCNPEGLEEYIGSFWALESTLPANPVANVEVDNLAIIPLIKYICFRCKPGYVWNAATKCCVRKFHCCNPPKQDTTGAYVCSTGYIFDITTYCCKPKCNNDCLVAYYTIKSGICYRCKPGCISVTGTPCCKPICCSSSEVYCEKRDEFGQCTSCSNGAELPTDFPCCPINVNTPGHEHNIDFFPEYGYFCTRLNPGSQWITPLTCAPLCCPQSLAHCYGFDKMGQCTECKDGWVLDQTFKCCKPDASYVFQYDPKDNDFCYVCPAGTVYNSLAGCIEICTKANALTCRCLGTACEACVPGWTKVNGICVEVCKKNHCLKYNPNTNLCEVPEPGYYVSTAGCPVPDCSYAGDNCKTRDADLWCTACNSGFYLSPQGCCIPTCPNGGCLVYSITGICEKCDEGTRFNQESNCCEPVCQFDACTRFASGWCVSCPLGYSLYKGCCSPICDDTLLIAGSNECLDGYRYNSTSTCCVPVCEYEYLCAQRRSDGFCTGCFTGSRFDVSTSCCLPVCDIKLCKKIMSDGSCIDCITGYAVNRNGCCEKMIS